MAHSLKIASNPAGATVELDGVPAGITPLDVKFLGRAPATLRRSAGSHAMVLKSPGLPISSVLLNCQNPVNDR